MPCQTRDEMQCIPNRSRDDIMPWETRVGGANLLGCIRDDDMPRIKRDETPYIPVCSRDNAMPRVSPDKIPCVPVFSLDDIILCVFRVMMPYYSVCIRCGVLLLSFLPENHHRVYLSERIEVELFEGEQGGIGCSGVFFGDECFPVEAFAHGAVT